MTAIACSPDRNVIIPIEKPRDNPGSDGTVFDAPLEVRVANLRAWQLSAENRGERLSPILEARLTALTAVAEDGRAGRAALPFRQRFPALHKWAAEIIEHRGKRTHLEVAAAYELVAVQCEEAGQWEYGARVRDLAARQFANERPA